MSRNIIQPHFLRAAAMLTLLAAGGCTVLPVYAPTPKDVRVTVIGLGQPTMCTSGTSYRLETGMHGKHRSVMVPTGQRVRLSSLMQFSGHQVISTCQPALSFVPQSGKSYIFNAGLAEGQCFSELVAEDKTTATGVAPEPSLGGPSC